MSIGLEWQFNGRDYGCGWVDFTGTSLPLLPVGSKILVRNEYDDWTQFLLQVKEIRCYYNVGKYANIDMICEVIEG